jgi:hypothetical protein
VQSGARVPQTNPKQSLHSKRTHVYRYLREHRQIRCTAIIVCSFKAGNAIDEADNFILEAGGRFMTRTRLSESGTTSYWAGLRKSSTCRTHSCVLLLIYVDWARKGVLILPRHVAYPKTIKP